MIRPMTEPTKRGQTFRKWSRLIHRDLSFFFAGVLLIYAISGFMLNHKRDFNSSYSVERQSYELRGGYPAESDTWSEEDIRRCLEEVGQGSEYMKSYQPEQGQIKVFIRRGCTLAIDTRQQTAVSESLHKRPILSSLNRLHYNPTRWWTIFSDLFLGSLVIIVFSGLFIIKGPKGLWGRGGLELLGGILIPILFMLFA